METMWNVYHYSQSEKIFALFKQLLEVTRDNYIITVCMLMDCSKSSH